MSKKYWHELTTEQKKEILSSPIKIGDFMEQYKQPDWCSYPGALKGRMGFWSLMSPEKIINKEYCKNCECLK